MSATRIPTPSRKLLNCVSARVSTCADKYNTACSALNTLNPDPSASWCHKFLILQAKDICGMSELKLPDHPDPEHTRVIQERTMLNGGVHPEGGQTLSWIWRGVPMGPEGTTGYNEGLFALFPPFIFLTTLCSIPTRVVKSSCPR